MKSDSSTDYDISVILTAHSEGRLAHRSVRSVQRAIHYAEEQGIKSELIAVLDRPSLETRAYFDEHQLSLSIVSRVDFQDSGLARNHGAKTAAGRYLAFLEAGNLFAENWLAAAYRAALAEADRPLVLHPEVNIFFGRELFLLSSVNSDDADYSPLELIEFNPWTAQNFVSRHFFLNGNQYGASGPGGSFADQNWRWNCEAIANGALHRVVPETAHFMRLKEDDLPPSSHCTHNLFHPSRLFDDASVEMLEQERAARKAVVARPSSTSGQSTEKVSAQEVGSPRARRQVKRLLSFTLQKARKPALRLAAGRPNLIQFFSEIKAASEKLLASAPPSSSPDCDWLIRLWRSIHQVEPELFPTREIISNLDLRALPRSAVAGYYPELSRLVGPSPTHIYLVPWVKPGGADLGAIHYMTASVEENPANRIVCLITEDADSPWLNKLPERVKAIKFGKLLAGFSEHERLLLLSRLLLQKRPAVIHNIHSPLGFKAFQKDGAVIGAQSSLFASIFCEDITPEGRTVGYAFDDLPRVMQYLSGVLTDNQRIVDKLCELYAFERQKFSVLYFPIADEPKEREFGGREGSLNILWAGRIDRQKRPDLLIQIASALVEYPIHFHVYGEPGLDPNGFAQLEKLKGLPNVTTHGRFDGFQSISATDYDVFLLTSQWEGFPLILLQATTAGLPIVAPDVGGVKELINERTGFLVSRAEAVAEYVEYLKGILNNREIIAPKVAAARALVAKRHSWEAFASSLRRIPGYFSEEVLAI